MSNKFYLFSKKSCGPCALVDKYFKSIKVDTSMIEYVNLEDFSDVPIPQENLDLAKKYGVTATPVLLLLIVMVIRLRKKSEVCLLPKALDN